MTTDTTAKQDRAALFGAAALTLAVGSLYAPSQIASYSVAAAGAVVATLGIIHLRKTRGDTQ